MDGTAVGAGALLSPHGSTEEQRFREQNWQVLWQMTRSTISPAGTRRPRMLSLQGSPHEIALLRLRRGQTKFRCFAVATWRRRSCRSSAPTPDSGSALSCGRSGCIPPARGTSLLAVEFWFVTHEATSHQPHRCTRHKTLSVLCDKTVSGQRVVTGRCAI